MTSLGGTYIAEICSASSGADAASLANCAFENSIGALANHAKRLAESSKDRSLDILLEIEWMNRLTQLTREEKQAVYEVILEKIRYYRKIGTDRKDDYYRQHEQAWAQALGYFAKNYFEAILPRLQLDLSS